ncbi:hypothetical protein A4G19_04405 [Pasteurellaceae bacterium Macca]|nr:hypothetical protein [Pasteurellaceae bacterium Macca]
MGRRTHLRLTAKKASKFKGLLHSTSTKQAVLFYAFFAKKSRQKKRAIMAFFVGNRKEEISPFADYAFVAGRARAT